MNMFNMGSYYVLVDYVYNFVSYEVLGGFVRNWLGKWIGVIGGFGDCCDEDFVFFGELVVDIFDEIIIKEDDDIRGWFRGNVVELIY